MLKEEIKYQSVTSEFQKDKSYEEFIEAFNNFLSPFEEQRYLELEETLPSLHVIGVPRSGTTILSQLIYSYLEVGYINNFIARFWKAPVSAIRISRQIFGDDHASNLNSLLGSTDEVRGLNEFNYFWYDMLDYEGHLQKTDEEAQHIDWDRLAKVIKNIIWAFEKPVLFKSFMLGWHAKWLQQVLPKTCFVWVRRDPTDNALSLLDMRRRLFDDIEMWASFKPKKYDFLKQLSSPFEQVAGQVYYLEEAYRIQLQALPESNYLILEYEEVCQEPRKTVETINDLLQKNGGGVEISQKSIVSQEPSTKSTETHSDYDKVHKAVQSFYS